MEFNLATYGEISDFIFQPSLSSFHRMQNATHTGSGSLYNHACSQKNFTVFCQCRVVVVVFRKKMPPDLFQYRDTSSEYIYLVKYPGKQLRLLCASGRDCNICFSLILVVLTDLQFNWVVVLYLLLYHQSFQQKSVQHGSKST